MDVVPSVVGGVPREEGGIERTERPALAVAALAVAVVLIAWRMWVALPQRLKGKSAAPKKVVKKAAVTIRNTAATAAVFDSSLLAVSVTLQTPPASVYSQFEKRGAGTPPISSAL